MTDAPTVSSSTVAERDWTMDDVELLIEIPGVYDGWSAAQLKDGRVVNRWAPSAGRRHTATEKVLAAMRAEEAAEV